MTTPEILAVLARFTGEVSRYPGTARVWAADGFVWGTDAVALACCPLDQLDINPADYEPTRKVPPRLVDLLAPPESYGEPVRLPEVNPQWEPCEGCHGLGGYVIDRDGGRHVKFDAADRRIIPCEDCDGGGRFPILVPVLVSDRDGFPYHLSDHVIARLRAAGATTVHAPASRQPAPCRADVGPIIIIAMPMVDDAAKAKAEGGAA